MIPALTILLVCQLVGEIVARGLSLPVPGPVIGLVLLAIGLLLHARRQGVSSDVVEETDIGRVAGALLANLGLLFVPAGAGVVQQLQVLGDHGVAIFAALLLSVLVTLVVTVAIFRLAKRARA